jgi:hypothetical protein
MANIAAHTLRRTASLLMLRYQAWLGARRHGALISCRRCRFPYQRHGGQATGCVVNSFLGLSFVRLSVSSQHNGRGLQPWHA